MVDPIEAVGNIASGLVPGIVNFGGTGLNFFAWLIIIILIAGTIGVFIFFFIRARKFNKTIVIFENINGDWQITRRDKAMEVKFSTAGDTILYLLKHRKYLPTPSLQSGKRVYWFAIRSDDEWINFKLKDLDQESKSMGAKFLDKEMRFARTQIQKGLKDRYDDPGFWKQYGLLVFSIAFVVIIGVMVFLLFDKWVDLANTTVSAVETAGDVMEKIDSVMGSLDRLCSGGSGFIKT